MPKHSQVVKNHEVGFMVYTINVGKEFSDELNAYRWAINNRPSHVVVFSKDNAFARADIASFPEEPFWWESKLSWLDRLLLWW